MQIDQAFKYLLDAPSIVKQIAAMSWQYLQAPQDGMVFLEWLPNKANETSRFPSDGYIWADPESTYHHDFGGYTIEIMVHTSGYRPGAEMMSNHARTRYHFISKNPNTPAAPPDPSLWIVHYHQAQPQHHVPSQQVNLNDAIRRVMGERRWLEAQGQLEKREFMLHDTQHWPQIKIPTHGAPGAYGANNSMANAQRYNQMPGYPQTGGVGPSPAKRPRTQQPAMDGAATAVLDTTIEDEENTALGDFFDHLTPRDISLARYMQHHRWMEEVFSSPYATGQIVPADLGLGLMGELKGLTEGILDAPHIDTLVGSGREMSKQPKEAEPFTSLKKDQIDEFTKRVDKHLEDGRQELKRMKEEHARKMDDWRKKKNLLHAEKRLRNASWDTNGTDLQASTVEEPTGNGHAEQGAQNESVDNIVQEVEGLLGVKIASHEEATRVEKGGLEEVEERHDAMQTDGHQVPDTVASSTIEATGNAAPPFTTMVQEKKEEGQAETQPQEPPGTLNQEQEAQVEATTQLVEAAAGGNIENLGPTTEDGMNMMESMDIDTSVPDFDQSMLNEDAQAGDASDENEPSGNVDDWVMVPPENTATSADVREQQQSAPEPSTDNAAAPATDAGDNAMMGDGDNGLFNDTTFDDFTNMDASGDGLIDFDGGMDDGGLDMGMDNSAFGDAFHGTEAHGENAGDEGGDNGGAAA